MIDLGPEQGIVDPKKILEVSKDKIKDAIQAKIDNETEPEKLEQFRKARRNTFYWNGIFNIAPTRIANDVVDYTQVGVPVSGSKKGRRDIDYNFNIIRGDFMKAVAVLGAKAPSVVAAPDEEDDEDSGDIARRADIVASKLMAKWDPNAIQQELMFDLSITGTAFLYTPWVVNGDKYGWSEEPEYDDEMEDTPLGESTYRCVKCGTETPEAEAAGMCPECGAPLGPEDLQQPSAQTPKLKGTKRYPNGSVEAKVCNIFECSYPFFAKTLKEAEWFKYEYETTPSAISEIFPKIPKEVLDSSPTQGSSGAEIRKQVTSESGIPRERGNTVRFTRYWLRNSWMNNFRDDEISGADLEAIGEAPPPDAEEQKPQTLMDLLKTRFQKGLRVTMVNGEIQDLFEESMDEVWCAVKPTVSKTIGCDPLCHDSIPFQELTNRLGNIGVATLLRTLPLMFVDSTLFDRKALAENEGLTGEFLPVKMQTGRSMGEMMQQAPAARMSDQMAPFQQGLNAQRREINGITESISGGGPGGMTAHEVETRKQQSLMQLRITYNNTRTGFAQMTENGVRMYAKYAPGQLKGNAQNGILGPVAGEIVEIADLATAKFHFEPDEALPRTFEDERSAFKEATTGETSMSAEMQHAVGFDSPVNGDRLQKYVGLPGAYYPGKDERAKLRPILKELLQSGPAPDGSPSVPPDEWDDAALLMGLMAAWLNSEAGRNERTSNGQGFQNAVAYWKALQSQANPPPPPPPLKPPSVSIAIDKVADPAQAQAIMQDVGLNVPMSQAPPPIPANPQMPQVNPPGASAKPSASAPPSVGGMGAAVPEPANPLGAPPSTTIQ